MASYLETDIGHELALQLAAERHVSVTPADLVTARVRPDRADHRGHVRDPPDAAGPERPVRLQPHRPGDHRPGGPGLDAGLVRRPAGAIRGRGHRTGGGPGRRRLERRRPAELLRRAQRAIRHRLPQRRRLSPARARRRPRAAPGRLRDPVRHGGVGHRRSGGGAQGCHPLPDLESPSCRPTPASAAWPPAPSRRRSTTTGCTCCCRSPRARRRRTARRRPPWRTPSSRPAQRRPRRRSPPIERRSSVSVNPQYGVWVPVSASVLTPFTPDPDGRAQRVGQRARGTGRGVGVGLVGRGCRVRRVRVDSGDGDVGCGNTGTGNSGAGTSGTGNSGTSGHRYGRREHGYRCGVLILGLGFVHPVQRLSVPRRRPHVTVVGLGPAGTDLLGIDATDQLTRAATEGRAYLRTARHPAAARFEGVPAFDHLYEAAATFDEVYAGIVEALVAAALRAAPDPIVYAVPGSPLVAERTVDLLRADGRVEVTARPALSFLDLAWAALGIDPLAEGVRLVDAGAAGPVVGREGGPFLVAQCWSRHLLSEVKLAAPRRRRPGAATAGAPAPPRPRGRGGGEPSTGGSSTAPWSPTTSRPSTSLPPSPPTAAPPATEVAQLVALMDTLRERCPWDSVQTHASLMPHLVEESYEVLDALAGLAAADAERRRLRAPGGGAGGPALPDRLPRPPGRRGRASSTWPTWRAGCTTSSCTGTRTFSATSTPTAPNRSSRTGRRSRRARRAVAA